MKQVNKVNEIKITKKKKSPKKKETKPKMLPTYKKTRQKKHPMYGTSKLEKDFASNFLDKLGIDYEYQFEAKDIKRFYDFYIPSHNTLIEIDGDYWHGNMDIYEAKDLKGFQKRAHNVDDMKNKWAAIHGMILIRIWEHEIRKSPESVMLMLKKQLLGGKIKKNKDNRNSRNINKLNIL